MRNLFVLILLIVAASRVHASSLITIPNIPKPERAYFADFNGDGLKDVVVGNLNDEKVGVIIRKTKTEFEEPVWIDLDGDNVFSMDLIPGDFDRDGKADVMVFNDKDALLFLKGNGDGTLQEMNPVTVFDNLEYMAIKASLNKDDKPDVLVLPPAIGKKMALIEFINTSEQGQLSFEKKTYEIELKRIDNGEGESLEWEHAQSGQFDSDPQREVLVINSRLNLALILDKKVDEDRWYVKRKYKTGESPNVIGVYDINRDGVDDFVIGHYKDSESLVIVSDEEGDLSDPYKINTGKNPSAFFFVFAEERVNLYAANYFYGGILQFKSFSNWRLGADPVYGEKLGERLAHMAGQVLPDGFELLCSSFHDYELKILNFRIPFRR